MQIDSVCLDCGEPIRVKVKDGKIESEDPTGLIGHISVPFLRGSLNMPHT